MSNKSFIHDFERLRQFCEQAKIEYQVIHGEISKNYTIRLLLWNIDAIFDRKMKFKEFKTYDDNVEPESISDIESHQDAALYYSK